MSADAAVLTFGPQSFDAVVCSLALMVIQPLESVLAEISRVLRPGGWLGALLPTNRSLSPGDPPAMGAC